MHAVQHRACLSRAPPALEQLQDCLRREAPEPVEALDALAQEWHRRFVVAEREALGHERARFALAGPASKVAGERYHRVVRCATTSTRAAGPGRVERSLSRSAPGATRWAQCGCLATAGGEAGHRGGRPFAPQRGRSTF